MRNKEGEVEGMTKVEETSTIEDKAKGPKVSLTLRSKQVTQVVEEAIVEGDLMEEGQVDQVEDPGSQE